MVKCFETQQMSEKFRRHLECEIVQFQFLSDDFSKFAFLLSDRTLEFHARYGFHYRTRIPKFGRDITYHRVCVYLFSLTVGTMRALRGGKQSRDLSCGSGARNVYVSDPSTLFRVNQSGSRPRAPDAGCREHPRRGGMLRLSQPRLSSMRKNLRFRDARHPIPRRRSADGGGERCWRGETLRSSQQSPAFAGGAR